MTLNFSKLFWGNEICLELLSISDINWQILQHIVERSVKTYTKCVWMHALVLPPQF